MISTIIIFRFASRYTICNTVWFKYLKEIVFVLEICTYTLKLLGNYVYRPQSLFFPLLWPRIRLEVLKVTTFKYKVGRYVFFYSSDHISFQILPYFAQMVTFEIKLGILKQIASVRNTPQLWLDYDWKMHKMDPQPILLRQYLQCSTVEIDLTSLFILCKNSPFWLKSNLDVSVFLSQTYNCIVQPPENLLQDDCKSWIHLTH